MADLNIQACKLVQSLALGPSAHPIEALDTCLEGDAKFCCQVGDLRLGLARKIARHISPPDCLRHDILDRVDCPLPALRLFRNAGHDFTVEGKIGVDETLREIWCRSIANMEVLPTFDRRHRLPRITSH